MNSGVYQILNKINGKSYIGSAINIKKRKSQHYSYLRKGKHPNEYLQKSWNKHSEINFEFKVLSECPKEYCLKLEQWFLDNTNNLYNIQKKSNSSFGRICKDETKQKIREKSKIHKHSKESKDKISESLIGNKRCFGHKVSTSTINLRINSNGYINYMKKKRKKVVQMDLNGNLIEIFESVRSCSKILKLDQGTISKICLSVSGFKTYKGFTFKYIN
jgi:group I intron endonuclease